MENHMGIEIPRSNKVTSIGHPEMDNKICIALMQYGTDLAATDIANYAYFCIGSVFFLVYDFYYYGYRQLLAKFFLKIFGGNPPYGPPKNLKISNFSKVTQHDLL